MLKAFTTIFSILLLQSLPVSAQDFQDERNPIDKQLEICMSLDSNYSTHNMVRCIDAAIRSWDVELNKMYKLLMESFDAELKEKLRLTQREWIVYKDNELKFMESMYVKMEGTMWQITMADRKKEIISQRAIELKDYYDTWSYK